MERRNSVAEKEIDDNTGEESTLFTFGTQVQAGIDEYNESVKTQDFWRNKLTGFALDPEQVKVKDVLGKGTNKRKIATAAPRGTGVSKRKKKSVAVNGGKSLGKKDDDYRKFGTINRETIRKLNASNGSVRDSGSLGDDMRGLYSQEEWEAMHSRIVESLPKERVGYLDYGQRETQEEGENVEEDGTHWATPELEDEELRALYDVSFGKVKMVGNGVGEVSGVFTLSQVLGERNNNDNENDEKDIGDISILEIGDSCGEGDEGVIVRGGSGGTCVDDAIEVGNTSEEEVDVMVLEEDDIVIVNSPRLYASEADDSEAGDIVVMNTPLGTPIASQNRFEYSNVEEGDDSEIVVMNTPAGTQRKGIDFATPVKSQVLVVPTSSPVSQTGLKYDNYEVVQGSESEEGEIFVTAPVPEVTQQKIIESEILNNIQGETVLEEVQVEGTQGTQETERIGYFSKFKVGELRKQLSEWGLKSTPGQLKEELLHKIGQIVNGLSEEKWKFGVETGKGGVISFDRWKDSVVEEDSAEDEIQLLSKKVAAAIRANEKLWNDVLGYVPISVSQLSEEIFVERGKLSKSLDSLGICWIE